MADILSVRVEFYILARTLLLYSRERIEKSSTFIKTTIK